MDVYNEPLYGDFTGFTFNKQHSSQFGLLRVSEGDRYKDVLVLSHSDEAADIPGGPGQYYWGETLKPKEFNIKIAYDNITEGDKRRIKKWLHPDDQLHELIFDERPYVKYWVKCSKEVIASELCFRGENGGRIYKGEFDITFIAYMPYGIAVGKTIEEVARTYTEDSMDSAGEWIESSGLLTKEEFQATGYDDWFSDATGSECKIYNPGDIEIGFTLGFQNISLRQVIFGGPDYEETVENGTFYSQLDTSITTFDGTSDFYIVENGQYIKIEKKDFPYVQFNIEDTNIQGQVVDEGNVSKVESSTNGKIYDIYQQITDKLTCYNYRTSSKPDFVSNSMLYAIDEASTSYKIEIDAIEQIDQSWVVKVYPVNKDIQLPSTLYIANVHDAFLDIELTSNPKRTIVFKIPGAATTNPNEWTEAQKAIFYNSEIKIDTNKQTIGYAINDQEVFGIVDNLYKGVIGIIDSGTLFKLPVTLGSDEEIKLRIKPRENSLLIKGPTIKYTYLYK